MPARRAISTGYKSKADWPPPPPPRLSSRRTFPDSGRGGASSRLDENESPIAFLPPINHNHPRRQPRRRSGNGPGRPPRRNSQQTTPASTSSPPTVKTSQPALCLYRHLHQEKEEPKLSHDDSRFADNHSNEQPHHKTLRGILSQTGDKNTESQLIDSAGLPFLRHQQEVIAQANNEIIESKLAAQQEPLPFHREVISQVNNEMFESRLAAQQETISQVNNQIARKSAKNAKEYPGGDSPCTRYREKERHSKSMVDTSSRVVEHHDYYPSRSTPAMCELDMVGRRQPMRMREVSQRSDDVGGEDIDRYGISHSPMKNATRQKPAKLIDRTGENKSSRRGRSSGNYGDGNNNSFESNAYQNNETTRGRSGRVRLFKPRDLPTIKSKTRRAVSGSDQDSIDSIVAMANQMTISGVVADPSINEGAIDPQAQAKVSDPAEQRQLPQRYAPSLPLRRYPSRKRQMRGSGHAMKVSQQRHNTGRRTGRDRGRSTRKEKGLTDSRNRKQARSQERNKQRQRDPSSSALASEAEYQQQQKPNLGGKLKLGGTSHWRQQYQNITDATNARAMTLDADLSNSHRSFNSCQSRRTQSSYKSGWSSKSNKGGRSIKSGKSKKSAASRLSFRSFRSKKSTGSKFSRLLKSIGKDDRKGPAASKSYASSAAASSSAAAISMMGQYQQDNTVPCTVIGVMSQSGSPDDVSSYCSSNVSYYDDENSRSDSSSSTSSPTMRASVAQAVHSLNQRKKWRGLWQRR